MGKWVVTLMYTGYRDFEVEAATAAEAEEKARVAAEEPAPWDNTPEISLWSVEEEK